MKSSLKNKLLPFLLTLALIVNPLSGWAQEQQDVDFVDESLRDITIVLGAGAAGAVLGLSTLSFVDKPKDHMKNISIGGAIGIVVGVAVVIFSQATKTQTITNHSYKPELNEFAAESMSRLSFSEEKIAAKYHQPSTFGLNLAF